MTEKLKLPRLKIYDTDVGHWTELTLKHPAARQQAIDEFAKLSPQQIAEQLPDILEKIALSIEQRRINVHNSR